MYFFGLAVISLPPFPTAKPDQMLLPSGIISRVKLLLIGAAALGAMAIAGGVLLTAAAGLIGTLAILRFGVFGLGAGLSSATFGMIGLGRASPKFGAASRNVTNFAQTVETQMSRASRQTNLAVNGMNRSAKRLRTRAVLGVFSTYLAVSQTPDDPKDLEKFQADNRVKMDKFFRATPILRELITAQEALFLKVRGKPQPDDFEKYGPPMPSQFQRDQSILPKKEGDGIKLINKITADGELPTLSYLKKLKEAAVETTNKIKQLEANVSAIEKDIHNDKPLRNAAITPKEREIRFLQEDLRMIKDEIESATSRAEGLKQALRDVSGIDVEPVISSKSIDEARIKVAALAAGMRALPHGEDLIRGDLLRPRTRPSNLQKRAGGGVFGVSPLLVGERGPEMYFPNRSGFIANNSQLNRMGAMAKSIRVASLAGLIGYYGAMALPRAASVSSSTVHKSVGSVTINVHIPPSVTDPQRVVDLISRQINDVLDASFSN